MITLLVSLNPVLAADLIVTSKRVNLTEVNQEISNTFSKISRRKGTLEVALIELNLDLTKTIKSLEIELAGGETLHFETSKNETSNGITHWRGKDSYGNRAKLSFTKDVISGWISSKDEYYKITNAGSGRYVILSKEDISGIFTGVDFGNGKDPCKEQDKKIDINTRCITKSQVQTVMMSSSRPSTPPSQPHLIKVLFLFANGASQHVSADTVIERIVLAESWTNDMNGSLQGTAIDAWGDFEIAAIDTINYNENNRTFSQHTDWVAGNTAIENARKAWGADVVAMFVDDDDNGTIGGIANSIYPSANNANFVMGVNWTYGHVFEHEMGHVLGMRHNVEEDNSSNPFPYGHGLRNDSASFRTIMSYICSPSCVRTQVFSNPENDFNGLTTGTYQTEDNARVFMETSDNVAAYRTSKAPSVSTFAECEWLNQITWDSPAGTLHSELKMGSSSNINNATLAHSGPGSVYWTFGNYQQYAFVRNCNAYSCTPWSLGNPTQYSQYCF